MKKNPLLRTYIVRINDDARATGVELRVHIDDAAKEIKNLAQQEKTFAPIMEISSRKGTITLSCDEAFSQKIMTLPFVAEVIRDKFHLRSGMFDLHQDETLVDLDMARKPVQSGNKTYIVTLQDNAHAPGVAFNGVSARKAALEIERLIVAEKTYAQVKDISAATGHISLACSDAFAEKVKQLPFVAKIEKEQSRLRR